MTDRVTDKLFSKEWLETFILHGEESCYYRHEQKLACQLADTMRENELLREALRAVDEAYCGVGDFEGTGENMVSVINQVREALAGKVDHGQ